MVALVIALLALLVGILCLYGVVSMHGNQSKGGPTVSLSAPAASEGVGGAHWANSYHT